MPKLYCAMCKVEKQGNKSECKGAIGKVAFWKQLCIFMFMKNEVYAPHEIFCNGCRTAVLKFSKTVKCEIVREKSIEAPTSFPTDGLEAGQEDEAMSVEVSSSEFIQPMRSPTTYEPMEDDRDYVAFSTAPSSQVSTGSSFRIPKALYLRTFMAVAQTEGCCTVCRDVTGRSRVSWRATINLWKTCKVYLPRGTRTCLNHLENDVFTNDAKTILKSERAQPGLRISEAELEQFLLEMAIQEDETSRQYISFDQDGCLSNEDYRLLTALSKDQFDILFSVIDGSFRGSCNRSTRDALGIFLCKMRLNLSQDMLAFLFGVSNKSRISETITRVTNILHENFVPKFLGFGHLSRNQFLEHVSPYSRTILGAGVDSLVMVMDATYIFTEKPSDHALQKSTFSLHKHRNLVKFMFFVTPDGYVIASGGPYCSDNHNNDAFIVSHMMDDPDGIKTLIREGDVAVTDRGFLEVWAELEEAGMVVKMPSFLKKGEKQFTVADANATRCITKVRYIVECVNGRLKNSFKFFSQTMELPYLAKVEKFTDIALAMMNAFFPALRTDSPNDELVLEVLKEAVNDNLLLKRITSTELSKSKNWRAATNEDLQKFPRFTKRELYKITVGDFQINNAILYAERHLRGTNDFEFEMCVDSPIVKVKIKSKMHSGVLRNVYVEFRENTFGANGIVAYYCDCKCGGRTFGCCSHVSSTIWYLGALQYLDNPFENRVDFMKFVKNAAWRP